jgi:hypothetical protein
MVTTVPLLTLKENSKRTTTICNYDQACLWLLQYWQEYNKHKYFSLYANYILLAFTLLLKTT